MICEKQGKCVSGLKYGSPVLCIRPGILVDISLFVPVIEHRRRVLIPVARIEILNRCAVLRIEQRAEHIAVRQRVTPVHTAERRIALID